jgi:hypothetical protein
VINLTGQAASGLACLVWFDFDGIVDGVSEPLLASQVSLRRLNADVPQQELNLLQLAAGFMAQTSASATKVMGWHIGKMARGTCLLHAPPRSP